MKHPGIATSLCCLLLFCATTSPANNAPAPGIITPSITTHGSATIEVVPNTMVWRIQVRNQGQALHEVATRHMQIVRDTRQVLEAAGVAAEQIQTTAMHFDVNRQYRATSVLDLGYFASTSISFNLADLNKYNELWLGLAKLRDASVQSVLFDHSARATYQDESRKQAILEAARTAKELAQTLKCAIGKPLVIEEDGTAQPLAAANLLLERSAATGPEQVISPGKIPIHSRVKAVFQLQCP